MIFSETRHPLFGIQKRLSDKPPPRNGFFSRRIAHWDFLQVPGRCFSASRMTKQLQGRNVVPCSTDDFFQQCCKSNLVVSQIEVLATPSTREGNTDGAPQHP